MRDSAEPIDIAMGEPRDLDIAFSIGGKAEYKADAQSVATAITGSNIFATIFVLEEGLKPMPETVPTTISPSGHLAIESSLLGAWIAMPIALLHPLPDSQAYLKPGEYNATIRVQPTRNGSGDQLKLKIFSKEIWKELDAEHVKDP